jgi:hypothetical protein
MSYTDENVYDTSRGINQNSKLSIFTLHWDTLMGIIFILKKHVHSSIFVFITIVYSKNCIII